MQGNAGNGELIINTDDNRCHRERDARMISQRILMINLMHERMQREI
jgi:hypothetical protein